MVPDGPDLEDQTYRDKQNRIINKKGYLLDPATGDIINNFNGAKMFSENEIDGKGEVPGPYSIDHNNFNPHKVRGSFDYDKNGNPRIPKDGKTKKLVDKNGAFVSERGYRIDTNKNLIDNKGVKKLKHFQMTKDGDVPRLYNYDGRKFDITDVIGQVDKDKDGEIILSKKNKQGKYIDNKSKVINSKGYLIDHRGNVINKDQRIIF